MLFTLCRRPLWVPTRRARWRGEARPWERRRRKHGEEAEEGGKGGEEEREDTEKAECRRCDISSSLPSITR